MKWIDAKLKMVEKKIDKSQYLNNYEHFKNLMKSKRIRGLIVDSTLNFSADAYRKLIEGFYDMLLA